MDKGFKLANEGYKLKGLKISKESWKLFVEEIKKVTGLTKIGGNLMNYDEVRAKLLPDIVAFENLFEIKEHKL